MKQNITIVASYYGHKFGVGVFMEKLLPPLINKLLCNNYCVILIVSDDFYKNSAHLLPQNVDVEIVRPYCLRNNVLSKFYFLFVFPLLSYVKKAKCVLYTSDAIIGYSVNNAIPIIHDLNDFEVENKFGFVRSYFRKKMIQLSLVRAKKVIVISKFVKTQIENIFHDFIDLKSIKVIYNGIEFPENENIERYSTQDTYFLVVGRLDPKAKKIYEAVTLYNTSKKKNPSLKLKIVGGINDYCKDDAQTFLQYIAKDSNIEYLGFVSDAELDALYKGALATIFLSKYEGFGFPLLEAFGRGCPVITNFDNQVNDELASGLDIKVKESELCNELVVDEIINQLYHIDKNKLKAIARKFTWVKTANEYFEELKK